MKHDTSKSFVTFTPLSFTQDAKLQRCSLAAQGLWLNIETMLHLAVPLGMLIRPDGTPMGTTDIAAAINKPRDEVDALLDELEDAHVLSVNDTGMLFSWHLAREKRLSETRAQSGSKGGSKRKDGTSSNAKQLGLTKEATDETNEKQTTSKHLRSSKKELYSSSKSSGGGLLTAWEIWKQVWSRSDVYEGSPTNLVADTKAASNIAKIVTSASEIETLFELYLADTDSFLLKHGHALRWLQSRLPAYRRKMNTPHVGDDGVDRELYESETRVVERRRFR